VQRIIQFARDRGMVCTITLGGRLCAGTINYRVHDNYFLETLAHDPAFDDYRLGMLCCYLSICECIARGGKEYHFLWGQDDYKVRLHGVQRDLDDLVIYRSHLHMLLNGDAVLQQVAQAGVRRAQVWLRGARRQHSMAARVVDGVLHTVRAFGSTRSP
jgi:CelD/BcsL family acetyltransferase involved in cellulose biosynthesis